VVQIQLQNNAAYRYLGYCYLRLGDVDKAMVNYGRAVKINDEDWEAHRGLGVAYMIRAIDKDNKDETLKARLRAKAIQQWRLSLELKPSQPRRERLIKLMRKYSE